ncbi:MAG: hypothetical protein PUB10_07885 [Clostridiales bacterium]|nr:hypothetical protein [Clostridiales bacterium]
MKEKVYHTMKSVGIVSLVIGILNVAIGIGFGIVMIINGSRLLKGKGKIMF